MFDERGFMCAGDEDSEGKKILNFLEKGEFARKVLLTKKLTLIK